MTVYAVFALFLGRLFAQWTRRKREGDLFFASRPSDADPDLLRKSSEAEECRTYTSGNKVNKYSTNSARTQ